MEKEIDTHERYNEWGEYQSIHKCVRCGLDVSKAEDEEAEADESYMPYCDNCLEDDED
jgi:hypothetical protein